MGVLGEGVSLSMYAEPLDGVLGSVDGLGVWMLLSVLFISQRFRQVSYSTLSDA